MKPQTNVKAIRYFQDGLKKVAKHDFTAAIDRFSKAIEAEPRMLDAYSFRGNAYIDLGQYEQALPDLDHVLEIDPNNHAAHYNRGIARIALGQKDSALADLDLAIQLSPAEAGYFLFRSIVHSQRDEYDLGLQDAAQAIKLGDSKSGHNNRAVIFEKKGDRASAIAEWTEVLAIEPLNATASCRRGLLLAEARDRNGAMQDLENGLKHVQQLPVSLKEKAELALRKLRADSGKSK
jgi:tetratricopeptide (TPR) repeat protein